MSDHPPPESTATTEPRGYFDTNMINSPRFPQNTHSSTSDLRKSFSSDTNARPPRLSTFCQEQLEEAIVASLNPSIDEVAMDTALKEARRLHELDLYKTQDNCHNDNSVNHGNVLVLVKFPESRSTTSCRATVFNTGRIRLTDKQVLATGSDLLAGLLVNERHQRRAKNTAAPLPEGVDYVLDLSPTTDENDYTIALQLLSAPRAVQLWHRSVTFGASPLAVAGHDDVCTCLLPFDEPYPMPKVPESAPSNMHHGTPCIMDTKDWPLEADRKIDDFCTTRWAANILRLFRAIAMPPGQNDLLIDSAPRMWTVVGLFAKLEMTNYDILRDEVVAWFNADMNHAFVELCPEETLHIGLILKTPLLTEPAFRILVNERALEVAGGQPRSQPTTTLFGRRCSEFTGTAVAESISRMIEHASNAMAERYKTALDNLCAEDALDILEIPLWQELRALEHEIPDRSDTRHVRKCYDQMMTTIRKVFQDLVEDVVQSGAGYFPADMGDMIRGDHFRRNGLAIPQIEGRRAHSVPRGELETSQCFTGVYSSLNRYQRALTPLVWHALLAVVEDPFALVVNNQVYNSVLDFKTLFDKMRRVGKHPGSPGSDDEWVLSDGSGKLLFQGIKDELKAYVTPLVTRDQQAFTYTMHPHLILVLNDHEMNFLRLADDESTFQTEAPETDLGPSGPGPAFHTGQTVPSVSDLDFEKLAVESADGVSTIDGGSMAAQDGVSTVYNRRHVLARSVDISVSSEQFTDGSMSAEYADAEYEVPAYHQTRGLAVMDIVEQADEEEYGRDGLDRVEQADEDESGTDGLEFGLDESSDSDSDTIMGDEDVDEVQSDRAGQAVDNSDMSKTGHSDGSANELQGEATRSEDLDDSDFEVIDVAETS